MRTTLVIDDDLYRELKAKAAIEGRTVTELVEEGMNAVLGKAKGAPVPGEIRRVRLPIVPADPTREPLFGGMTQDEIHERLNELQRESDCQQIASPS